MKSTRVCAALLLLGLYVPGALLVFRVGSPEWYTLEIENRKPARFWDVASGEAGLSDRFRNLDLALADNFPLRGEIINLRRRFDRDVGGRRFFGTVTVGNDGWYYYRDDAGGRLSTNDGFLSLQENIKRTISAVAAAGKRIVIVVAPAKQEIYPEHLGPVESPVVARFESERRLFYSTLESFSENVIPRLRDRLLAAKTQDGVSVYQPQDTHHSAAGAMLMAQTIVEALDPNLWNPQNVNISEIPMGPQDLAKLMGLIEEPRGRSVARVRRPGVRVVERELLDGEDRPTARVRFRMSTDGTSRLLPGRSVIIHDSFIGGFLRPSLAEFFEDVTFIHYADVGRSDLERHILNSDRVVIECVERMCLDLFARWAPPRADGMQLVSKFDRPPVEPDVQPLPGGAFGAPRWNTGRDSIVIPGWVPFDTRNPAAKLILRDPFGPIELTAFPRCETQDRPDVAARFPEVVEALHYGFLVHLPTDPAKVSVARLASLELYAEDGSGNAYRLISRGRSTANGWNRREGVFDAGVLFGDVVPAESDAGAGAVSRIEIDSVLKRVRLSGWIRRSVKDPRRMLCICLPEECAPAGIINHFWMSPQNASAASASEQSAREGFVVLLSVAATPEVLFEPRKISVMLMGDFEDAVRLNMQEVTVCNGGTVSGPLNLSSTTREDASRN